MKTLIRALALWACMGASAFAQVGMGVLPFGGAVAAAPVGPPVFTYQDIQGAGGGSTTITSNALTIGTPSYSIANRRVYALVMEAATGTSVGTSASFNGGAISADVFQVIGTTPTDGMNIYLVSAIVPTGTTCTVSVTYPSTQFAGATFAAYTVDTTTLVSINPATTPVQSVVTSATSNPITANTFGVPTSAAGSAILAGLIGVNGISTGTQSITSSDASLSTDGLFSGRMAGHANSAPVSASSNVNTGWTSAGDSLLVLVVLR